MRRVVAVVFGMVVLAACGSPTPTASPRTSATTEPVAPVDGPAEESGSEVPGELALTDAELLLSGDTGVLGTPGETVDVDHLVYNRASGARSFRFQTMRTDLDATTSISSVRLGAGESVLVTTSVTVPEDAAVGEVITFDMVAVLSDDTSQRATEEVRILVADATGSRPTLTNAVAETKTNQKVVVYLLGAASDPDGDIDPSSLRVVGGGFRSADMIAGQDGTLTYFPFQNVTGEDRVLFEICDAEQRCDTAVLTVDVGS